MRGHDRPEKRRIDALFTIRKLIDSEIKDAQLPGSMQTGSASSSGGGGVGIGGSTTADDLLFHDFHGTIIAAHCAKVFVH